MYNQRPGYTYLSNYRTFVTENGLDGFANSLVANFASSTDAELAAIVTSNLGLTGDALAGGNAYLEGQFAAAPAARGAAILAAMNLLSTLENNAAFGTFATAYNADVSASLSYSTVVANTAVTGSDADATSGQNFVLTANLDNITGSSGDDSISGAKGTIDSSTIDGGAGTDTLSVTLTNADDNNSTFVSSNVENFSLRTSTGAVTLDLGDVTGVTSLAGRRLQGNLQLDNVQDLNATIKAESTSTGVLMDVNYAASVVSGTSDAVSVTVDSSSDVNFDIDGIETITLTGTSGASSLGALDGSALATVNVVGDQNITIETMTGAGDMTVDASALTGNLDVTLDANDDTVTGGAGDDTINMLSGLTAADTIDGGEGADTLIVDNEGGALTVIPASASVTNVETLRLEATDDSGADAFTLDANIVSFNTITIDVSDENDTYTISDYTAETLNIVESANNAIALLDVSLVDATGSSDSLTVNVTNSDATNALTVTDIDSTDGGIETLNLVANQGVDLDDASDIIFGDISSTHSSGVFLTGDADVTLGSGTSLANTTLDTSGSTGDITATLGNAIHTVTLGNGTNSITFDAARLATNDTVTGGTGADTVVTGNLAAGTRTPTLSGVETVTAEFGTASSGLSLASATGVTTLNLSGDENHVVSGIDGITAINVASTDAAAGDTVSLTFDANNTQDLTVTIGDVVDGTANDDVDTGALAITTYAGALTLVSDGAAGNLVQGIDANTATSLTISTVLDLAITGGDDDISATDATTVIATTAGAALTIDDDLLVDEATSITLNATNGNLTITDDVHSNTTATGGVTDVTLTATSNFTLNLDGDLDVDHMRNVVMTASEAGDINVDGVVLTGVDASAGDIAVEFTLTSDDQDSTINFDTGTASGAGVIDKITVVSGAGSTASVDETTITNADTDVTITEIDASAAAGDLVIDLTTSNDAVTITSGSGDATITGTTALDTITLGSGANTVRTQGGADEITAGTGVDTIIGTFDSTAVVTGFDTDNDIVAIDLSEINGAGDVENLVSGAGTTDLADYFNAVLQSDADGTATLATATNIFVVTGVMANNAAILAALDDNVTYQNDLASVNDSLMVLWTNGSSTFVSVAINDNITADANVPGYDEVNDLIELSGITITDLAASNFDFVA